MTKQEIETLETQNQLRKATILYIKDVVLKDSTLFNKYYPGYTEEKISKFVVIWLRENSSEFEKLKKLKEEND